MIDQIHELPGMEQRMEALRGEALPEGMTDYHARCAIRDLINTHGVEKAREKVDFYFADEAKRSANHSRRIG